MESLVGDPGHLPAIFLVERGADRAANDRARRRANEGARHGIVTRDLRPDEPAGDRPDNGASCLIANAALRLFALRTARA